MAIIQGIVAPKIVGALTPNVSSFVLLSIPLKIKIITLLLKKERRYKKQL